jgi:hypothetical protein
VISGQAVWVLFALALDEVKARVFAALEMR